MRSVTLLLLSILFYTTGEAAELAVGDTLAAFVLQDQHEQAIAITPDTRILLFSRGMKGSKMIEEALESLGTEKPQALLYVADISGMPALIAKFVALPQMRDLPYSIALDSVGELSRDWPGDKESATVIRLQQFTVTSITQVTSAQALLAAIE